MSRHCVSILYGHFVFVTKYRRKVLSTEILDLLAIIFNEVCDNYTCQLVEFEGELDHVHLLINYPPSIRVSDLVRSLKTQSSSIVLSNNFNEVTNKLWKGSLWTPSYFVSSCGGVLLEIIKDYIRNQDSPRT